jgi:hypothetical protein
MPGVPPITFDLGDFTTPQGLVKVNDWFEKMTLAVNTQAGLHGPVTLNTSLNLNGNSLTGLADPVNPTDAVHLSAAQAQFGPAAIQSAMEATGNEMLQTVRRINDTLQREQYSSFLNDVLNLPPTSNTSTVTVVAAGANSTITVSAGTFKWGDQSVAAYAQRIDSVANPGAGVNVYYYYLRKSDTTVQFIGPFTADTSSNQLAASFDGRGYLGKAVVNVGGGGTGGGGSDPPAQGGCLEIGTPLAIPEGKKWSFVIEPCNDWIVIHFRDGRKIVAARDTRIAIFKKVQDLDAGDLAVLDNGQFMPVTSTEEDTHESHKMKMSVEGRVYYGAGVLFSNFKPNV